MKIKNKICGLIGAMALLTACTEETPIDDQTNISTESLSITFSTEAISTTKSGTESATNNERKVSSCFIGFFELDGIGTPGKMIFGNNYNVNTVDQEYNYTVNDIIVPEKEMSKQVRVLVIANPPKGNLYATYSAYNDFTGKGNKGIVSCASASAFDPLTLIKVGEVNHTFSINSRTAKVDLRQLAAKVSVEFTLEKDETLGSPLSWNFVDPYITVSGIVLNSPLLYNKSIIIKKNFGEIGRTQVAEANNNNVLKYSFYTYQYISSSEEVESNSLLVKITCGLKAGEDKSLENLTYKAQIYPNYTSESVQDGILSGYSYKVTGALKVYDIVNGAVLWQVVDIEKINDIDIPPFN